MSEPSGFADAIASRYRIERQIGRGGMATVFLADDLKHRRKVAIKRFDPELALAVGPERFLREIQVVAGLGHPHIVPLYDSDEVAGWMFYVMPFIEGESLAARIQREGRLSVADAVPITRQVASALDHAHARGVVHRDIKPENILLLGGEALVADFGIALPAGLPADVRMTGAGLVVGTPAYMSPEQALGETVDGRSDQYALACVVFEMLTGELPFAASSPQKTIAMRLVDAPPSARRLRPSLRESVDAALSRAMSIQPAARFASASAFADALTAAPVPPTLFTPGAAAVADEARPHSVAVLPFRSLSADPENEYFADGITEDVTAHLSKIRALRVISRTSVMGFRDRQRSFREIGEALGATSLLDGSVRRAGDRVRIVARLVDAASDRHLWADTYDRQLTDIFEIQTDVALQIASALAAELSPDERSRVRRAPTQDIQAYQLFLRGRARFIEFTPESIGQAVGQFERAIARDPSFALAHANLALAHMELAEHGSTEPAAEYRSATAAATRAVQLDPDLGEARTTLAYLRMVHEYEWAEAEREFRRALELNPNGADTYDLYGRLCWALARYDDAIALLERARDLDPLAHRTDLASVLLRAGRYDEAARRAELAVELDPTLVRALMTLGWAYFLGGRRDEGLATLERAVALAPADTLWLGQLGEAYGLVGRTDDARDVLRRIEEIASRAYVSSYHFAYVYTGLGQFDRALDLLERAVELRSGPTYGIGGSFLFAPLRGEPRFQALLRRMNIG